MLYINKYHCNHWNNYKYFLSNVLIIYYNLIYSQININKYILIKKYSTTQICH